MCITMNIKNTALSEQFQNQRAKSHKEAKLTHLAQIHLALYRHFHKKWQIKLVFLDLSFTNLQLSIFVVE